MQPRISIRNVRLLTIYHFARKMYREKHSSELAPLRFPLSSERQRFHSTILYEFIFPVSYTSVHSNIMNTIIASGRRTEREREEKAPKDEEKKILRIRVLPASDVGVYFLSLTLSPPRTLHLNLKLSDLGRRTGRKGAKTAKTFHSECGKWQQRRRWGAKLKSFCLSLSFPSLRVARAHHDSRFRKVIN